MPINFTVGDRPMIAKASPREVLQFRSVVGGIAWIARQCRRERCYFLFKTTVSRIMSIDPGIVNVVGATSNVSSLRPWIVSGKVAHLLFD